MLTRVKGIYYKLNHSLITEWSFRIFITLSIVYATINYQDHSYPDVANALTLISLWLYFFKQKFIALFPLLLAMWFHIDHAYLSKHYYMMYTQ